MFVIRAIGYVLLIGAVLTLLGVAGADCDGKCMENSLSMGEIFSYLFGGVIAAIIGFFMVNAGRA